MSKSVKAVTVAPSTKAQERAFLKAQVEMSETPFGELTHNVQNLLVSKGGKRSSVKLFDQLICACDSYPLDVVAHACLALSGNAYAAYRALLELESAK